jgi:hypothetical protein
MMFQIPYTYFTIRGDMQDAFFKTSEGRTFTALSPTLRIDYILFCNSTGHQRYSDHFMLVADLLRPPSPKGGL